MENIEILKATPDDALDIQNLTAESSKGMYRLCDWTDDETANHFSPEKITEGANKLKESITSFTENDILLVAKDENNKIIGCCFADTEEKVHKIQALYLLEEFQGTGLAKLLYEKTYSLLNPDNDTFLDVFSLNSKAIKFYKKMGFQETGKKTSDKRYTDSSGKKLEITEMKLNR
jgi:ribosomal protein S18 acetylase RimI-like enzyme